jgi:hypothetical protein
VNEDVAPGRRWFLKKTFCKKNCTPYPFRSFEGEEYAKHE